MITFNSVLTLLSRVLSSQNYSSTSRFIWIERERYNTNIIADVQRLGQYVLQRRRAYHQCNRCDPTCINSRCDLVEIRRMSRYVLCPPAMKGAPPPFRRSFRTPAHFVTGRWEQFDISFGFVHDVYPPMLRYTAYSRIVRNDKLPYPI